MSRAASVWVRMTEALQSVRCFCSTMVPKLARDVMRERSEFVRVHDYGDDDDDDDGNDYGDGDDDDDGDGDDDDDGNDYGDDYGDGNDYGVGAFASRECTATTTVTAMTMTTAMTTVTTMTMTYALASWHCANPLAFLHSPALGLFDASSRHVHRRFVGRQLHLASSWPPAMRTRSPTRRTIRVYSERR